MSCMNIGKRLQPAKKAWKIFTTTLHSKLRRLGASKSIDKSKTRVKTTTKASSSTISPFRVNNKRKKVPKNHLFRSHKLSKRSAPVYIDDLFNKHVLTSKLIKEIDSTSEADDLIDKRVLTCRSHIKEKGSATTGDRLVNPCTLDGARKREKVVRGEGGTTGADDMWESLQMASPMMHGINERADEFIARIKAEMHLQEIIARRL